MLYKLKLKKWGQSQEEPGKDKDPGDLVMSWREILGMSLHILETLSATGALRLVMYYCTRSFFKNK